MSIAIKAENISKQYRLGEISTGAISHDINRWWHKIRGKENPYLKIGEANDRTSKGNSEYVWSLQDINFEIQEGDAVGIIGRNGAGKSTLLKILSKVTQPTTGSIKTKGRIASLLEVGTGFHPELSGRDNIYLNGAILGMRKSEIKAKFDEIVDFSGVERYIDTPVKRYSSGMYVRLAFAVAAFLESEILIVDEVLAVGDYEFQKKCLGKMSEVSKGEGRTVLFVSHNMAAIKSLCANAIYLKNGFIKNYNSTENILLEYINNEEINNELSCIYERQDTKPDDYFFINSIILQKENQEPTTNFNINEDIYLSINYTVTKDLKGSVISMLIENTNHTIIFNFDTDSNTELLEERKAGNYNSLIKIPKYILKPGYYSITLSTGFANISTTEKLEKCIRFRISLLNENEAFIGYAEKRSGIIAMPLEWVTNKK